MGKIEPQKPRLGISACLLGERVRWDGGHKRAAFLVDILGPLVEWVAVCPEVEIGLGVPRPPIRLAGAARAPRLVAEGTGEDLTGRMARYAKARVAALARLGLDGYVLKSRSPSCGLHQVPVHPGGHRPRGRARRSGRGLFAAALVRRLPWLPVEEENRLADPGVRQHFLERVFTAARWRRFRASRPGVRELRAFHAAQKAAVLARSARHHARLGRLAEAGSGRALGATLDAYGTILMDALAVAATRRTSSSPTPAGSSRGRLSQRRRHRARARQRPRPI